VKKEAPYFERGEDGSNNKTASNVDIARPPPPTQDHQWRIDRAARTTTAILQETLTSPPPPDLRARVEAILRDEFADLERQVVADLKTYD
jgi:hypothetical protein